jgi:glycosyltransferase involved in cell wall biosynthesis
MRALIIPYFDRNPYQDLLAQALSKHGVKVEFKNDFRFTTALKIMQGKTRPDILHIHWTYPYMLENSRYKSVLLSSIFILKLRLLKLLGLKLVWTVHNTLNHEKKFGSIDLFYRKILVRLCNKVIVHGKLAKTEIENLYGLSKNSKISIIPHGNYRSVYKNDMTKNQARKRLNLSKQSKVLLYFGYIRQYKGIPDLLKVFQRLKSNDSTLLIVGNPKSDAVVRKLEKECQGMENVKLYLEYIPDDEIQIYMNAADFVVLPFKDILTSGSMMLALSFGKPIIVPDMGHIREVSDNVGNIVYDPKENDALFKSVQTCLRLDDKELEQMGSHNLQIADKFGWDKIGEKTYLVYQEAMKSFSIHFFLIPPI